MIRIFSCMNIYYKTTSRWNFYDPVSFVSMPKKDIG